MPDDRPVCCSWARRAAWATGAVVVVGAIAAASFLLGRASAPAALLAPRMLDATASDTGEEFGIATGMVSEDAEGLFVLDHATGLLQCQVVYPRTGSVGGVFTTNIKEQLPGGAGGKGAQYLMVTGIANFPGGSNQALAPSVCYVLDCTTGAFAAYGVPFSRSHMVAGRPQQGILMFMGGGQARGLPDRER